MQRIVSPVTALLSQSSVIPMLANLSLAGSASQCTCFFAGALSRVQHSFGCFWGSPTGSRAEAAEGLQDQQLC